MDGADGYLVSRPGLGCRWAWFVFGVGTAGTPPPSRPGLGFGEASAGQQSFEPVPPQVYPHEIWRDIWDGLAG
ncbi:MAG: hypothetical protein ACRDSH_19195, partial [Pseudonocardiaceae bacterium]